MEISVLYKLRLQPAIADCNLFLVLIHGLVVRIFLNFIYQKFLTEMPALPDITFASKTQLGSYFL